MSADLAGSGLDRIEDILADLAAGRMVVILDDEDGAPPGRFVVRKRVAGEHRRPIYEGPAPTS